MLEEIKKKCKYCDKDFLISKKSQEAALGKGGKVHREYCNKCLLLWRKGEIDLESHEQEEK